MSAPHEYAEPGRCKIAVEVIDIFGNDTTKVVEVRVARDLPLPRHGHRHVPDDHPPPHFHVRYGAHRAVVDIGSLAVIAGSLPPRALGLVTEWAALARGDLLRWRDRVRRHLPPERIAPLE